MTNKSDNKQQGSTLGPIFALAVGASVIIGVPVLLWKNFKETKQTCCEVTKEVAPKHHHI